MLQLFLVCLTAGLAAGIGTGFAGLSAATVIAPMLIAFLGFPWYESVGIGLASDVLASALAAWIYKKHGNIDLKNGSFMLASVLAMTVAGSYFSQYMPDMEMGYLSIIMSFCMGLRFIIKPVTGRTSFFSRSTGKRKTVISVICGLCIGFYCGFMGLGGGRSAWGIDTGAYYIVLQCGWGLDADICGGVAGSRRSVCQCGIAGAVELGWRAHPSLSVRQTRSGKTG